MCCKVLETWGIDSDEDQLHIRRLKKGDCIQLIKVCMATHSKQGQM
jgi:hypothetical protein